MKKAQRTEFTALVTGRGVRTPAAAVRGRCPRPLDEPAKLDCVAYYTKAIKKMQPRRSLK